MKQKYKKIVKAIELKTGFDIVNKDEIKDDKSASEVCKQHINWLRSWAEEMAQHSERVLMDAELYHLD